MRIEKIFEWLLFQPRKIALKVFKGNRFYAGVRCKISPSVRIQFLDQTSSISIGAHSALQPGVELSANRGGRIIIGDEVFINRNVMIAAMERIEIGDGVSIGPNVCIYDHNHSTDVYGSFETGKVIIGKKAWIGAGVIILPGCTIGENAVVAAGSIVTKDVPDNTVLIQKRTSELRQKGESYNDGIK